LKYSLFKKGEKIKIGIWVTPESIQSIFYFQMLYLLLFKYFAQSSNSFFDNSKFVCRTSFPNQQLFPNSSFNLHFSFTHSTKFSIRSNYEVFKIDLIPSAQHSIRKLFSTTCWISNAQGLFWMFNLISHHFSRFICLFLHIILLCFCSFHSIFLFNFYLPLSSLFQCCHLDIYIKEAVKSLVKGYSRELCYSFTVHTT
jgi:hypothetical protein